MGANGGGGNEKKSGINRKPGVINWSWVKNKKNRTRRGGLNKIRGRGGRLILALTREKKKRKKRKKIKGDWVGGGQGIGGQRTRGKTEHTGGGGNQNQIFSKTPR